ncbi:MAG: hypothetical protein VW516_14970, partial [Rhodospirillaceae bacterium]
RLDFADESPSLICLPTDKPAYARLSRLLTLGKRRAGKAQCHLTPADLANPDGVFARGAGQILIVLPPDELTESATANFSSFLKLLSDELESETYLAASH